MRDCAVAAQQDAIPCPFGQVLCVTTTLFLPQTKGLEGLHVLLKPATMDVSRLARSKLRMASPSRRYLDPGPVGGIPSQRLPHPRCPLPC